MLDSELRKVIQGTSALKPEMLNKKHEETDYTQKKGTDENVKALKT